MILKWNDSHLICMRIIAAPEEEQKRQGEPPSASVDSVCGIPP